MKINVRILLITFSIVVLISVTSILVFYSLTVATLNSQHSKSLLNSASDFAFVFQKSLEDLEDDFLRIKENIEGGNSILLLDDKLDFVFETYNDSLLVPQSFRAKDNIVFDYRVKTLRQFLRYNPDIILDYFAADPQKVIYYGAQITKPFLDELAKRIRAEVALIRNQSAVEISHESENLIYAAEIKRALNYLSGRSKSDLYIKNLEEADFLASYYIPHPTFFGSDDFSFIIFFTPKDAVEYQGIMRIMLILIVISGVALSVIFVLLFTAGLRKQISLLSSAAEAAGKGNLDTKVEVITTDEIGRLGMAFNSMLEQIRFKEKAEMDYAEFIALINQNPTLKELADIALEKIVLITEMTTGILYLVEDSGLRLLSSYGLSGQIENVSRNFDFYKETIHKRKLFSLTFEENLPVIKTGLMEIKIRQLLLFPVIYNKKVIAVIELASTERRSSDIKDRIERILEQLAIGLINAKSFEQLENLVNKLQVLNKEYSEQNVELKILHDELKLKAEELEEQRSKAVELTQLKSQFLATMSHELKTPLNAILGLSELIMKDASTAAKSRDRIKIVLRNGKKLLNLINNILDFSKLESGKIELTKETFLLKTLLREIELFIESLIIEKDIVFKVECVNSGDILLNTDRLKLEQVLINLLSNSVKFTEEGVIKIEILLIKENDIKIIVTDTGIGITEDDQKIIFEEFRQADGTTSRKFSGTGLGLAICKKYVELIGGSLSVESTVGQGASFTIVLPNIVQEKIGSYSSPKITLDDSVSESPALNNKTITEEKDEIGDKYILIVDDDNDTLFTVSEILSGIGLKTGSAHNGVECLLSINDKRPDLVLLDIMMPQMDGFETIKRIRKDPNLSDLMVVALTAYAMLENKEIVVRNGFDDIITKPIDTDEMISTVKKYIKKKIK
ncbi:MAG: ATP-binding protein [bacterium]